MAKKKEKAKRFKTPVFRVQFANVFVPRAMEGKPESEAKYGLTALWIDQFTSDDMKEIRREVMRLAKANVEDFDPKDPPENWKWPWRDGKVKKDIDGFEKGEMFSSMSSKFQPDIATKTGGSVSEDDANGFYNGCYAKASIHMYYFERMGNQGIAFGLNNLLKVADGEKLTSRTTASDDFADEIDEPDEDDLLGGSDDDDDDLGY